MNDVKINLYYADHTDGPVKTVECEYWQLARMHTKTIADHVKGDFIGHIKEGKMVLELEERGGRESRSWVVTENYARDEREYALEVNLMALVQDWRSVGVKR